MLVSVLGDSISTFEGFNPPGFAVFYDAERQRLNGLNSVYDTWWAKVNQALHAYLCVNNSFSGGKVSGTGFPAAFARVEYLSNESYIPDLILLYIGYNDFGYGVKPCKEGIRFGRKKDTAVFEDAYQTMLERIKEHYPSALIVCGTLMKTCIRNNEAWAFPERFAGYEFERYNQIIRKTAKQEKCLLADLAACQLRYETLDGSHPTKQGHQLLADAWIQRLNELGI